MQGLDYRFDASGSKLNSFIDGDFRDLTELSGQLNYHATNNFMVFGAVDYQEEFRPRLLGHAAGPDLVCRAECGQRCRLGHGDQYV